ncbi:ubiquitin-conjugating enzyme/RWD-like protein [Bombardia bombarda]|uniref:Ubiquitin-conjugating enzyme/RWD-like protein n=1 Tax=Bombardia bombarda TaxID=252184 RepID=A0AA39XNP4_9PEZI|nr:ubiquitin-conjugating enzyme/RWD-like protein [Bombardia bombarda]
MASTMSSWSPSKMGNLPSVKRQHLLAEFAGLKQACPSGVFLSLTPGDPTLWSGVMFVRKGPYAPAVLRFQISFPDLYPSLPPLVTFSTDLFHPLITPLTTYMYTTDIHDNGTVSASDDERLPPGGFSLRHGFPGWFGRSSASISSPASRRQRQGTGTSTPQTTPPRQRGSGSTAALSSPSSSSTAGTTVVGGGRRTSMDTSTYEVLRYMRSTFDDAEVLDAVPLEAAGNPGAWHAWRTHRRQTAGTGKPLPAEPGAGAGESSSQAPNGGGGGGVASPAGSSGPPATIAAATPRRPGEWNWEGVWEDRSKKGITNSLSEAVLYGNAGTADEVIHFLSMEDADIERAKRNLLRTLGEVAMVLVAL